MNKIYLNFKAIELELNKHANITTKDLLNKLPEIDLRINHILTYFSCNNLSRELKILALLDLFRIQIFPDNNIKFKILQTLAHTKYNDYVLASAQSTSPQANASTSLNIPIAASVQPTASFNSTTLSPNTIKNYEKWQNDYRDFRSIIAAFINGVNYMEAQRYVIFQIFLFLSI